jgi:hypothetical protein
MLCLSFPLPFIAIILALFSLMTREVARPMRRSGSVRGF